MLKRLGRSDIKETITLLTFTGLMAETLTPVTIFFSILGSSMVWLEKKPTARFRHTMAIGLFISYWISYGKVIDPEVGINFLTSVIVLKLLEKETSRDRYMIFFGLILLISAGALFQKSILYVMFFGTSFFFLIQDFYKNLKLSTRIIDIIQSLIWVLPFSALLFFFAPRLINPFQLDSGGTREGEVGYTPEVTLSNLESLSFNERPVFQARLDTSLPNEELYWRGNTLSFSDGWNWPLMPQDRSAPLIDPLVKIQDMGIKQSLRLFTRQDFFFGLDHPSYVITPRGTAVLGPTKSMLQNKWQTYNRYQIISYKSRFINQGKIPPQLLRSGLKQYERKWVEDNFRAKNLDDLKLEIQRYFQDQQFTYSLAPGKVDSFLDFMQNKKIGFCSHYASAVANILRVKKIPSRLVSGFLGGTRNKFAQFYLITQNDAHVWVEAYFQGSWQRLDPTGWIAPDRVRLGGEAYMQEIGLSNAAPMRFFRARFNWFNNFQQWFGQWDFRFYQWLEEMDYYGQEALLDKLRFKRSWLFSMMPILVACFMGLYIWYLTRKETRPQELEYLWKTFQNKLLGQNIRLPLDSIRSGEVILRGKDEKIIGIWQELITASFEYKKTGNLNDLKRKIQNL